MNIYMNMLKELILADSILVYILAFVVGFIASLNPHMLGMVPMYMGYILKSDQGSRKWMRLFLFALSFATILTILGISISGLGASLHPIMRVSYVIAGFIYLYMGLRLFGFSIASTIPIEILVIPSSRKSRTNFLGNILMPLIFTPCSIPFVISILTLAMVKGSIIYGGGILFSFGMGHSLMFVLFGTFSNLLLNLENKLKGYRLVHKVFAVFMIVLGIVFLSINQQMPMNH
jgi:cytochrome c-type biogenesis protein